MEEINFIQIDFGPQLTPEQRTWPVISLDRPRRGPTAEPPRPQEPNGPLPAGPAGG